MTLTITNETLNMVSAENRLILDFLDEKLKNTHSKFQIDRLTLEEIRIQLKTYEELATRLKENSDAAMRYLKMMPDDPEETPIARKVCPKCDNQGYPWAKGFWCPLGHGEIKSL